MLADSHVDATGPIPVQGVATGIVAGHFTFIRKSGKIGAMGAWFAFEFWLLALVATWMTATAIVALRSRTRRMEDMNNLYEQVIGAVRTGDLPRAILILEGEPGSLAKLLSSVLTECTKLAPKLRVAYKISLESLKRQGLVALSPLRMVVFLAPLIGILGFLGPAAVALMGRSASWIHALWLLLLSAIIAGLSWLFLSAASKLDRDSLTVAGDLGRKLLNYLLGPESPLTALRGRSFPIEE
jgi:hypothetical protein